MIMKKIIHTIGFVEDNNDVVILGIIHEANKTNVIRLIISEEDITLQQLEGKTAIPEIPPDAAVRITRGRV